jgi:hypothetical protein
VQAAAKTNQAARSQQQQSATASRFGIRRRGQQLEEAPAAKQNLPEAESEISVTPAANGADKRRPEQEDYLLARLLHQPDLLIWLAGAATERDISPPQVEDWQNIENREIFRSLKQFITSDEQWDLELFQESLTGHLHGKLGQLLYYSMQMPQRELEELQTDALKVLLRMRIQCLKVENTRIKYLLDETQRHGYLEIARNFDTILYERSHLEQKLNQLSRVSAMQMRFDQGVKIR